MAEEKTAKKYGDVTNTFEDQLRRLQVVAEEATHSPYLVSFSSHTVLEPVCLATRKRHCRPDGMAFEFLRDTPLAAVFRLWQMLRRRRKVAGDMSPKSWKHAADCVAIPRIAFLRLEAGRVDFGAPENAPKDAVGCGLVFFYERDTAPHNLGGQHLVVQRCHWTTLQHDR